MSTRPFSRTFPTEAWFNSRRHRLVRGLGTSRFAGPRRGDRLAVGVEDRRLVGGVLVTPTPRKTRFRLLASFSGRALVPCRVPSNPVPGGSRPAVVPPPADSIGPPADRIGAAGELRARRSRAGSTNCGWRVPRGEACRCRQPVLYSIHRRRASAVRLVALRRIRGEKRLRRRLQEPPERSREVVQAKKFVASGPSRWYRHRLYVKLRSQRASIWVRSI